MRRRVLLFGASGRIGSSILQLVPECEAVGATAEGVDVAALVGAGPCAVVLAVPAAAARVLLAKLEALQGRDVLVLDCSGVAKQREDHLYNTVPAGPEARVRIVGNPGCIASAVLDGLRELPVDRAAPLSVVATGDRSYAPEGQCGEMRSGRRWLSHPHVREIELHSGCRVACFVPVICYAMEATGLLVVVAGRLSEPRPSDPEEAVDAASVAGTARLARRLEVGPELGFTLTVVIDNVVRVAWHAANLIRQF